jgi:hypothetical protein
MAEDEGGGVMLGQVDRRVRQWLKGVRLSVIAVVLEAIRDELESRARAAGSRTGRNPAPGSLPANPRTGWAGSVLSERQPARSHWLGTNAPGAESPMARPAETCGIRL